MATRRLTWCDVQYSKTGSWRDKTATRIYKSDMAVLGIPYDGGSSATPGQNEAPFFIRRVDTFDSWYDHAYGDLSTVRMVDCGDLDIDRSKPHRSLHSHSAAVSKIFNNTKCLVALGGDHSISSFTIRQAANFHKDLRLIHIDAHSDRWQYETGDPYPGHESWIPWVVDNKYVFEVVQLGVRGMGPPVDQIYGSVDCRPGILSSQDLKDLAREIKYSDAQCYLSVDMDVVEPAMCPGVAYREPGGWLPFQLLKVIEELVATGKVIGVDIVEVTPSLDRDEMSVRLAHRSVLAVVRGIKRSQVQTRE